MGSKWKLPSLKGEGGGSSGRESPAFHRLHKDENDEERQSLVDSEADSDDDLMTFDKDKDKESSLHPAEGSPYEQKKKHRKSPLNLLSPLTKSNDDKKSEERRSLIEDETNVDTNDNEASNSAKEVEKNATSDGDMTPAIKKPVPSKWGMLKKPAEIETNKSFDEERSDVVGGASLNKNNQPESSKPGGAWLKLKEMKNNNPTEEAPDNSTSPASDTNAAPKLSGWGKLKARQNPQNNESPATPKVEPDDPKVSTDPPKSSGWGKLRARQKIPRNDQP